MDRPYLNLSRYLVLMLKEMLFPDFMKQPRLPDQLSAVIAIRRSSISRYAV